MPEGDVVRRTAQRLDAALGGRRVLRSDLRWPSLATVDLSGRTVTEVVSVGKHLLTRLSAPDDADAVAATGTGGAPVTLHSHLRMEGSWHLHRSSEPWGARGARRPEDGVRAVLANQEWTAVGHRLGMLDLVPTSREDELVGHLGPDLLAPDWNSTGSPRALANLQAAPDRPVGEAMLDQRVMAGVGTFYMAESLFVRGVTPWTPVSQAGDLPALLDVVQRMLAVNVVRVPQSTTGDLRPGRTQWVHARAGRPCRRCGTKIRVETLGRAPQDRVAFFCPRCQRGPTA